MVRRTRRPCPVLTVVVAGTSFQGSCLSWCRSWCVESAWAAVPDGAGPFPQAAARTGRASFPASGSPVVLLRGGLLVDAGVAAGAHDQGFPSAGPHGPRPVGRSHCGASVEVGESLDVVDGDPVARVA